MRAAYSGATHVVEGATLTCTQGSSTSRLAIPDNRGVSIGDKKQANIGDHAGGVNIMSFGTCTRAIPPPGCIMATVSKWIGGQSNLGINGEPALLSTSVNFCACGGVVSIVNDGQ